MDQEIQFWGQEPQNSAVIVQICPVNTAVLNLVVGKGTNRAIPNLADEVDVHYAAVSPTSKECECWEIEQADSAPNWMASERMSATSHALLLFCATSWIVLEGY